MSSTAGGGATGVAIVLGLTLLPGFGQFVAAGAAAGATLSTVTSLGGIIGATGGAIAKMLTDQDVDGTAANFYESQIDRGKIVLSVSLKHTDISEAFIRRVLRESGGHIYSSL